MIAVAASGLMFVPALSAQNSMGAGTVRGKAEVDSVLALAKRQKSELDRISGEANVGFRAANFERLLEDRDVWPNLVNDAMNAIAAAGPQPELLGSDLRRIKAIDAGDRRLVLLEDLSGAYAVEGQDRFVRVQMELAFSNDSTNPPTAFINDTVGRYLNGLAAEGQRAGVPYLVVPESFSSNPGDLQQVTVAADGSSSRTSASPSGAGRGSAGSGVGTPGSFGGGGGLGAGGGSTGSSGGGQPGKRRPGGNIIDPNADPTGMGNSGGGFVPGSSSGGGGSGFGGSGSSGGGWNAGRSTGSGTGDSRSDDGLNIESEAPIPGEPSLYAEGDVFHVARVTFTVKLIDPQETSPDA
jgi:hypothetical protein